MTPFAVVVVLQASRLTVRAFAPAKFYGCLINAAAMTPRRPVDIDLQARLIDLARKNRKISTNRTDAVRSCHFLNHGLNYRPKGT
jgi:hypothetical protein